MNWRTLAAKYDIPYRGLPDLDSGRQYGLDDVPMLLECLRSRYYLNREVAARHLGHVANRARGNHRVERERAKDVLEPAVDELEPLLSDESPRVRRAAAGALAELRTYFPERIPQSVDDRLE